MLAITQNAIDAVNEVAPGDTGLRIYLPEQDGSSAGPLRLEIADSPAAQDQVVEVEGARVFLEPAAALALDNMVLDAASEGNKVRFTVAPQ